MCFAETPICSWGYTMCVVETQICFGKPQYVFWGNNNVFWDQSRNTSLEKETLLKPMEEFVITV